MDKNQDKPNILMRIGVIVGILIILFVITIGVIKLVPKALSSLANISVSFSSLFKPVEKISVAFTPNAITTGQTTTLSYTNNSSIKNGNYTLSYECQNGVKISYKNGNQVVEIVCNTNYPIAPINNSVILIGSAPVGASSKVPVTLSYTTNDSGTAVVIKGAASLTISNGTNSGPTGSPTPTTATVTITPTVTPRPTNYPNPTPVQETGQADLVTRLIDVGIISPSTNQFISTRNFTAADTVVLKFEIQNIGTKRTGSWSFQTTQPMSVASDVTRSSGVLATLLPGYSTGIVTLGLSGMRPEGGVISVVANPNQNASESNYSNNSIQIQVAPSGTSNGGGTGYGNADLSITITNTGIVDRYSNQFIPTTNVHSSDKVRVQFLVKNIGGRETGSWTLSAFLPTASSGNFTSQIQNSLRPGAEVSFSIDFDGLQQSYGNSVVSITLDPNNMVYESNEGNNSASTYLNVSY